MISERLKSLVKYIESKDQLIDIGCDHALLDIYLIKNKILEKIVISDINQNALNQGIKNINKYGFEKQIETKLGNGLEVIDKNINTALISGMGATTIINILSHQNLKYLNKIIIQSNNNYDELRKAITKMGFYIKEESTILERGKYYINILFLRGNKKYSSKELKYGPILMQANKDYYEYLLNKETDILNKIPKKNLLFSLKQKKKISTLNRLINSNKLIKRED